MERVLLLVDDEPNILAALTRLLRRDGYRILRAGSGKEGLDILQRQDVGVILSDQRMPEMTGVEFLSEVKKSYPDTVRLVLSGYTDLNSVTDAINQGAIYKFLTKPWDDDLLRDNVREAFEYYELRQENERLTQELQVANGELADINRDLEQRVELKTREAMLNLQVLKVSQEVLEHLPLAVLGIAEDGLIAVANRKANELLSNVAVGGLVGMVAEEILPGALSRLLGEAADGDRTSTIELDNERVAEVWCGPMGKSSGARGFILALDIKDMGK